MSSIGSNQSSKRWELASIAECESSGLLATFFMAWSPGRRFNAGDSRLMTRETTPPSIPTNPATGPASTRQALDVLALLPWAEALLRQAGQGGLTNENRSFLFEVRVGQALHDCAIVPVYEHAA